MSRREHTAEPPLGLPEEADDPELTSLPRPSRPGRNITLAAMVLTTLLALGIAWSLRAEASYALRGGAPRDLGDLTSLTPEVALANTWVRGGGQLMSTGAIRYGRALESDGFRLAQLESNPRIWVEVRVPEGAEGPHFAPPSSFVGRLVPFDTAGLRHAALPRELERATGVRIADGAWLLIDGESPREARWALGVIALMLGFAAFNLVGLRRLLAPVQDA